MCGVNNARMLRNVLASLDTKQQAIIMGHAVPMPVVIKTRTYDETFYKEITRDEDGAFRRPMPGLKRTSGTGSIASNPDGEEPPPGKEFEDLMKELYGL